MPHWTAYFSALLTPVVAIFGLYLGYQQLKLARHKQKYELFDRRLKVYEAASTIVGSIMVKGKVSGEDVSKLLDETREAKWLFNDTVAEYLDKVLFMKATDLQVLQSLLEDLPVGEERTANAREQGELRKWFREQYGVLDEMFSPFLKLPN
jgi:hypothetical protein